MYVSTANALMKSQGNRGSQWVLDAPFVSGGQERALGQDDL